MDIRDFLLYQPWLIDFPSGLLETLKRERDTGRLRLPRLFTHGKASFLAAGTLVACIEMGARKSEVDMDMWVVEFPTDMPEQYPSAMILRIAGNYYFADHTMLKSVSIQRDVKNCASENVSKQVRVSSGHVLCFNWPMDLQVHVAIMHDEAAMSQAGLKYLTTVVESMSSKLSRNLCDHPLFLPLWFLRSPAEGSECTHVSNCHRAAVECSEVLSDLLKPPCNIFATHSISDISVLSENNCNVPNKDDTARLHLLEENSIKVCHLLENGSMLTKRSVAISKVLHQRKKSHIENIDSLLCNWFPDNETEGRIIEVGTYSIQFIGNIVDSHLM